MTKAKEIKQVITEKYYLANGYQNGSLWLPQRYKSFNARVEKKDGETLIESIVDSIGRMLIRRMDAAKCIVRRAEEYAESFHRNESLSQNFTYFSSKYSLVRKLYFWSFETQLFIL